MKAESTLTPPHKPNRPFFKQWNAESQHTTEVGPEVFVVSHSEVLKSREGCRVAAAQVGYMTQRAPPGDTNNVLLHGANRAGRTRCAAAFPACAQTTKLHETLTKNK